MTLRTIWIVIVNHGLRETITMRASAAVEMLGASRRSRAVD
jgi:hypothetical protein